MKLILQYIDPADLVIQIIYKSYEKHSQKLLKRRFESLPSPSIFYVAISGTYLLVGCADIMHIVSRYSTHALYMLFSSGQAQIPNTSLQKLIQAVTRHTKASFSKPCIGLRVFTPKYFLLAKFKVNVLSSSIVYAILSISSIF